MALLMLTENKKASINHYDCQYLSHKYEYVLKQFGLEKSTVKIIQENKP